MDEESKKSSEGIINSLDQHFQLGRNVVYERFVFGSCNRGNTESIEHNVCKLIHLAASCKYGNLESEFIRDRLVLGVSDISLRKKLPSDARLTLTTDIDTVVHMKPLTI